MRSFRWKRWLFVLLALSLAGFGAQRWYAHRTGIEGWTDRSAPKANRVVSDQALRAQFAAHTQGLDRKAYDSAFVYLLEGQLNYRSPLGARVYYPGSPSFNGRISDGLEGFARFFPIAAAWLAAGRPDTLDIGDKKVSVSTLMKQGLLAGTDREGPEFWGVITSRNQRLVESADIALALWISREQIWAKLSKAEQRQVTVWLQRALVVDAHAGNWSLFPVVVHRVLIALDVDDCCNDVSMARMYREFKQLEMGGGWIADGSLGADYYNAWAIQYLLFWLDQIDPQFDPKFIRESNRQFAAFYKHLISPSGAPLWGRSVCYRMATAVPLLTAQVLAPDVISPGLAMRALDATWGHFVTHGATANGVITQGFCGPDLALVNEYTAPGSCLWGARSLIVALYLDPKLKLLDSAREKLPVERGDFKVTEPAIKWTVEGFKDRGEVVLTLENNADGPGQPNFTPYRLKNQLREWLAHYPNRPYNHKALYERRQYSTRQSWTACERVNP